MEVCKMLTISTAHISAETAELLDYDEIEGVVAYNKGGYGWFIYTDAREANAIPADLRRVLDAAYEAGCEVLCLDNDGERLSTLPVYQW